MGTFFRDIGVGSTDVVTSIALDAIGLPARPLTVAATYSGWTLLEPFSDESLLTGLIWASAVALLGISCAALIGHVLTHRWFEVVARFAALVYALDGTLQLPCIVAPVGSSIQRLVPQEMIHIIASYPVSHSGVFAVTGQVWGWLFVLNPWLGRCYKSRLGFEALVRLGILLFSLSLRFMSMVAVPLGSVISDVLYVLFCVLSLGSLITWEACLSPLESCCSRLPWEIVCKKLNKAALGLCNFLALIWPRIGDCWHAAVQRLLSSQLVALLQPCWYRFHTLFMPAVMACVASACHRDVLRRWDAWHPGLDQSLELATNAFCGGAATVSVLVLGIHGSMRAWSPRSEPNPLQRKCLLVFLESSAWAISLPWRALRLVGDRLVIPVVRRLALQVEPVLHAARQFAETKPIRAIPVVLLASYVLIRFLPALGDLTHRLYGRLPIADALHADFKGPITDSSFAMLLIASVQVTIYTMVDNCLRKLRQVHMSSTREVIDVEEQVRLAETMQDPRQCPNCGFGPVSYAGCADLRAHHHEIVVRGAYTDNSCPRCGYFSPNLDSWLPFDGDMQTPAGQAMLCQRKWNEVVLIVRAVSKALLLTYGPMCLGRTMGLPPSWRVLFAVSYLAVWTFHNAASLGPLFRGEELGHIRGRQQQARRRAPDPELGGASCGAPAAAEPLLPRITQSEALRSILAHRPARIYLRPGDPCAICRRGFAEASAVVGAAGGTTSIEEEDGSTRGTTSAGIPDPGARSCRTWMPRRRGRGSPRGASVEDVCQRLENLPEPVVAMRCGHVLHLGCAEACIAHAALESNGHVRCPQCRQPVTVSAEAAAVFFS